MKPPITAQQAACLSLLLYGETGNAVARILGVTPGCVSHWRKKLEALGLIGPPGQAAGGRPRKSADEEDEGEDASAGAGDGDALDYLPPEARHWLRQGWGEFAERERAAQAAGTDYFSRTRPDRKRAKKRKPTPSATASPWTRPSGRPASLSSAPKPLRRGRSPPTCW